MAVEGIRAPMGRNRYSEYTTDNYSGVPTNTFNDDVGGTGYRQQSKTSSPVTQKAYSKGTVNRSALIFPSDLGTSAEQQNYMIFFPKKISGGSADARTMTFTNLMGYPCVCLPIPSGLNAQYTQSWSAAEVAGRNSMISDKGGAILERIAKSSLPPMGAGGGQAREQGIAAMVGRLASGGSLGGAWDMTKDVGSALSSTKFWDETAGGVASEMAAMVAAGPMEGLATAAQYTTGMRAVKQTMMSYGGPGFRSFSYTFSLKPMRQAESQIVYGITKLFKELSAPEQQATRYTRVYDLPAVFKIMFYYGGKEHPHIAKIGHCALTNLSITYGGGKFSTFAGTHSPVQTDITINFQEMELLNRQMLEDEPQGGYGWPLQDSASAHAQSANEFAAANVDDFSSMP